MPRVDSPPVSRVRVIRMHGLKGGPALACLCFNHNARQGRIYQWTPSSR
jgi:hypothetical protein